MTVQSEETRDPGSKSSSESNQISWIDRTIGWIESLPGPTWAFYLVASIVLAVLNNWVLWYAGALPVGEWDPEHSTDALWVVYFIGVLHYLNGAAKDALNKFRPLLSVDEIQFAELENKLTILPARPGWLALGLAAGLQVVVAVLVPGARAEILAFPLVTNVYQFLFRLLAGASFFSLVFHTIRQLRLVSQLHRRAKEVSLFRLGPPHAFSNFTSRLGSALILITIFGVYQLAFLRVAPAFAFFHITLLLLALAAFVLPLMSIRSRLIEEKGHLLDEVDGRIEGFHRMLVQARVDDLESVEGVPGTLQALRTERAALGKISTWPWSTETIRRFSTTFFLPIILWAITRFLERFF